LSIRIEMRNRHFTYLTNLHALDGHFQADDDMFRSQLELQRLLSVPGTIDFGRTVLQVTVIMNLNIQYIYINIIVS
jgi:hypothetical protein